MLQNFTSGDKLIDISKYHVNINKDDDRLTMQRKMNVNRFLKFKDNQLKGKLTDSDEKIYNKFIDGIKPNGEYYSKNGMRQHEKNYLASIADREKTEFVEENKEDIRNLNDMYKRQDLGIRVNYEIGEEDKDERD